MTEFLLIFFVFILFYTFQVLKRRTAKNSIHLAVALAYTVYFIMQRMYNSEGGGALVWEFYGGLTLIIHLLVYLLLSRKRKTG
jgi:hypothetical protein